MPVWCGFLAICVFAADKTIDISYTHKYAHGDEHDKCIATGYNWDVNSRCDGIYIISCTGCAWKYYAFIVGPTRMPIVPRGRQTNGNFTFFPSENNRVLIAHMFFRLLWNREDTRSKRRVSVGRKTLSSRATGFKFFENIFKSRIRTSCYSTSRGHRRRWKKTDRRRAPIRDVHVPPSTEKIQTRRRHDMIRARNVRPSVR